MATRAARSRLGRMLVTFGVVVLFGGAATRLICRRVRQTQLDAVLVEAVQRRGVPLAAVRALLDRGASPNARAIYYPYSWYRPSLAASPRIVADTPGWLQHPEQRKGSTVLIWAAISDRPDLVRELLSQGANPRLPNGEMYGADPILICTWGGATGRNGAEVARLLLDHGADVNARSRKGNTPLMLAASGCNAEEVRCHAEVTRLLLSRGADPNARNDLGWTALHHAVSAYTIEPQVVQALLQYGADVNARANDGLTPLGRAGAARGTNAVRALLRQAGGKN